MSDETPPDSPPEASPEPESRPENRAEPPAEARFQKGQSGNPGGRPKSLQAFRTRCRNLSREILDQIKARLADPEVPLADLLRAFESIADRGGFLSADKQAGVEASQGRLLLLAMAVKGLTREQKNILLGGLERELLTGGDDGGPG